MRKILIISICLTQLAVAEIQDAAFKLPFQRFDNVFLAGLGMYNLNMMNGNSQKVSQNNQFIETNFEHLFDMRLYLDLDAYLLTHQSVPNVPGTGMGANQMPLTQNPSLGGVNAKVGYAFEVIRDNLQLIPYGVFGRNTNIPMTTVVNNEQNNIVNNDYFITVGIGGRVEYKINDTVMLYLDQNALYNMDQSGPIGMPPQNTYSYSTVLGAKFAVIRNLQLGINAFYTKYVAAQSAVANGKSTGGLNPDGSPVTPYMPQDAFGGVFTVGYAY